MAAKAVVKLVPRDQVDSFIANITVPTSSNEMNGKLLQLQAFIETYPHSKSKGRVDK